MPVFGHCSKSSHNPGLFWTTVLLDTNLEMISKKKCATIGFSFWIISQSIAKSKNSSNDQRISLRTLNMNHSSYCVFCAYNDFPTEILVRRGKHQPPNHAWPRFCSLWTGDTQTFNSHQNKNKNWLAWKT